MESVAESPRFFVGTCGYAYPGDRPQGWDGVFYPTGGKKRRDELVFSARFFSFVEINSTFYRPASPAVARRWLGRTHSGFTFAVQARQKYIHTIRRGDGKRGENWQHLEPTDGDRFVDGIRPLADARRLGPLWVQYPASFACDAANRDRLEATLAAFDICPRVVELRHRSWSDDLQRIEALLARNRATWVVIDEPKVFDSVKQDLAADGEISYLRLHWRNQQKWWNHRDPGNDMITSMRRRTFAVWLTA